MGRAVVVMRVMRVMREISRRISEKSLLTVPRTEPIALMPDFRAGCCLRRGNLHTANRIAHATGIDDRLSDAQRALPTDHLIATMVSDGIAWHANLGCADCLT
ncbi:hypothetical protein GCM10009079_43800 [Ralstonia mannitolilytica]|jgi:hypothetical protein|nr:hypothetical protein C404_25975 [Ralstonia sp. AU12-08]